ncbi:hypothetical protein GALMADRAFT_260164, partial [Galerina marginata CBS 339.88]
MQLLTWFFLLWPLATLYYHLEHSPGLQSIWLCQEILYTDVITSESSISSKNLIFEFWHDSGVETIQKAVPFKTILAFDISDNTSIEFDIGIEFEI